MRALYNINFNESTASSAAIWAKQAEALINNYAICVVSIVGTVLNLFTLLLLANNSFKHKFYDFLRCRCLCNLVVCAFGIAYVDVFCRECPVNYVRLLLYSVLVHIPVRMAFLASAISDVLLIINRLLMLYDKKESGIYKLTKKVNLFICYGFAICFFIPAYTMLNIVKVGDNQAYWTLPESNIAFYQVYVLTVPLVETIIPTVALTTMNIISLAKFNRLMELKRLISGNSSAYADKTNMRFTKLIVALTFICIFARTFDFALAMLFRAKTFLGVSLVDDTTWMILSVLQKFALFSLFSAHALDAILYYHYDKLIRRILFDLFKKQYL